MESLPFFLSEVAEAVRETVRNFALKEVSPRAHSIDKKDEFPRDLWPKLGALGLLGLTVEEEDGGAGMGYLEHMIAMEELSRYGAILKSHRVVDDGNVVTGGAVTAGIDLALWLVQRELGDETATTVARAIAHPMPKDVWRASG